MINNIKRNLEVEFGLSQLIGREDLQNFKQFVADTTVVSEGVKIKIDYEIPTVSNGYSSELCVFNNGVRVESLVSLMAECIMRNGDVSAFDDFVTHTKSIIGAL